MSIIIRDEISGKPITIENPLLAEHIEVGRLLWYNGYTSMSQWNCPAVITKIDTKNKRFRVRSLDDMREQEQWYEYSAAEDSASSRQTMRLTTPEDVKSYLDKRQEHLKNQIDAAKKTYEESKAAARTFANARKRMSL